MKNISIYQALQNNLKISELEIPLHKLVVFAGPSGSGKSSLAIETILREGQRRCVEALRASISLDNQRIPRPKVERIDGLPPTFGMKQDLGNQFGKHQTIADLLGVQALLENIYIQSAQLYCPDTDKAMRGWTAKALAFHLIDHYPQLSCHIIAPIRFDDHQYGSILEELARNGHTRIQHNDEFFLIEDAPSTVPHTLGLVVDRLKVREENTDRLKESLNRCFQAKTQIARIVLQDKNSPSLSIEFSKVPTSPTRGRFAEVSPAHLQTSTSQGACIHCHGLGSKEAITCVHCNETGLGLYSQIYRLNDCSFASFMTMKPLQILQWIESFSEQNLRSSTLLKDVQNIVQQMHEINLNLPLYRKLNSLSTGERSRVRMLAVLLQTLGACLYILDEPSLGLDDETTTRVLSLLKRKRDAGHSFIVVDHHPLFLKQADLVFHFGPKSGTEGGEVVETPCYPPPLTASDIVSKQFPHPIAITPQFSMQIGALHVIQGASGSGKSRLLTEIARSLSSRPESVLLLNQLASLGNKRSTVVTIVNIWGELRTLLANTKSAKLLRLQASDFSFNRKGGRCETCMGLGSIAHTVPPLPPSEVECPECLGKRFSDTVLEATYRDLNIWEILNLSIDQAIKVFEHQPTLFRMCAALQMVGLGYLTLGQSSPTLSGGEHRRLQLAQVLAPCLQPEYKRPPLIVLLDDPTAALHPSDAQKLQRCFLNFRQEGITLILASNNPQMRQLADVVTTL